MELDCSGFSDIVSRDEVVIDGEGSSLGDIVK
jgi:hypothetical protein